LCAVLTRAVKKDTAIQKHALADGTRLLGFACKLACLVLVQPAKTQAAGKLFGNRCCFQRAKLARRAQNARCHTSLVLVCAPLTVATSTVLSDGCRLRYFTEFAGGTFNTCRDARQILEFTNRAGSARCRFRRRRSGTVAKFASFTLYAQNLSLHVLVLASAAICAVHLGGQRLRTAHIANFASNVLIRNS
jgi:hypothetical protein